MPKRKAVYLRKSRDESHGTEDVLAKHRRICMEVCEKNAWEYTIYEEVGTSDSLEARPHMMRLLDDVEDGLYDGVVVVEYERLSRGDEMDAAYIKRALRKANVKIIEPGRSFDLNDENDEVLIGVSALLARSEFRKIKRRLARGKREGAKMGKWVQGNPPFPYHYDSIRKQAFVEESVVGGKSKRLHYLDGKADLLAGVTPGDVAIKFNTLGVYGNRGKPWVAETVKRVYLNPFHMGRVIYGKTRETDEGRVPVDRNEWIEGDGDHELLKTPDEHARLLEIIASRRRIANRSREGSTPLSGLVKCGLCGKTQQSTLHRGKYVIFPCTRRSPTGEICPNSGVHAVDVYRVIREAARSELEVLTTAVERATSRALATTQLLEARRRDLATVNEELSRLVDLATSGLLSKEMFAEKQAPKEAAIRRLKAEIAQLEATASAGDMPVSERKERLAALLDEAFWTDTARTTKDRHNLLTSIIDRIALWSNHKQGRVEIEVMFM